jgi:hypothetical protein
MVLPRVVCFGKQGLVFGIFRLLWRDHAGLRYSTGFWRDDGALAHCLRQGGYCMDQQQGLQWLREGPPVTAAGAREQVQGRLLLPLSVVSLLWRKPTTML